MINREGSKMTDIENQTAKAAEATRDRETEAAMADGPQEDVRWTDAQFEDRWIDLISNHIDLAELRAAMYRVAEWSEAGALKEPTGRLWDSLVYSRRVTALGEVVAGAVINSQVMADQLEKPDE